MHDSRNVEVLQSKVYIVGQGREETAFVQNLGPRSRIRSEPDPSEDESGFKAVEEEEEEEEAVSIEAPPKKRSKRKSSKKKKKKRAPVVVVDEMSEEEKEVDMVEEEGQAEEVDEERDMEADDDDANDETFIGDTETTHPKGTHVYKCRYCEKVYTHSASRKTHERKHTGEVPFSCPSCGRGFNHSSNFKRHLKLCKDGADLEILPFFKCSACGQHFKHKKSLSTHYKFKHERPDLECEVCGGKFPTPAYLKRHKDSCPSTKKPGSVRPEKRLYYCQVCGWNSRVQKALETHMTQMHNQTPMIENKKATPKKRRSSRKRDSADGQVDEKPLVIDLANAKWMGK